MGKFLTVNPAPWATNANYPAGALPWSGGPTRINPGSGALAAGFAPAVQPPAEVANYQLGVLGDTVANLGQIALHNALQSWRYTTYPGSGGTLAISEVIGLRTTRSYDSNGERQRPIVMFGADPTNSNKTNIQRSNDASLFDAPQVLAGSSFPSVTYACAGAPGVILLTQSSPQVAYSLDHGTTWTQYSWGAATNIGVHYAIGGNYYAVTTSGTVYASATVSGFSAPVALPSSSSACSGSPEFADDALEAGGGGNNVILCVKVASNSFYSIYWTNNGGTSWTKAQDLTSSSTAANITRNRALGLFVAWDNSGAIWTSPTGQTWTQVAGSATPAFGFVSGRYTFCSAGIAIVKSAANTLNASAPAYEQHGVAYSVDLGQSWNYFYFAGINNSFPFSPLLRGINNRVYAVGANPNGGAVWTSGLVGAPDKEI